MKQKHVSQIDNVARAAEPTFKSIFGDSWNDLPPVMHKRYAVRPYMDEVTTVEGVLDIVCAGPIKLFAPIFWLMGTIPPRNERSVPVTVSFESDKNTKEFRFNRVFHFRNRKPYRFQSRMIRTNGNEVIEIMRFGLCWKMNCVWEDGRVKLKHKGYFLQLFGHFIPAPLTMLLGEGSAEEKAVDDSSFDMSVEITHPWWGKIYEYKGRFKVTEN